MRLLLSPATYWELAIKVSLGKYQLTDPLEDYINEAIGLYQLSILAIEVRHAATVATLPPLIVGRLNIEFSTDVVQSHNRNIAPVLRQPMILSTARQAGHDGHVAGEILVGNVVQVRFSLAEESEPGMVRGEGIRLVVATRLLSHELPKVQVRLGPRHGVGVPASGVGQSE